jgi:pilus assembly protein TadC
MRIVESIIAFLLAGASFALYAIDQPLAAFATTALAALVLAHNRGDDLVPAPKHRARATAAILLNLALVAGLVLEVLYVLGQVVTPRSVIALRGDWVFAFANVFLILQCLLPRRDPRFASSDLVRLLLVDIILTSVAISCWIAAALVLRLAPVPVADRLITAADGNHLLLLGVLLQAPVMMLRRGVPTLLLYLHQDLALGLERRGYERDAPIYYPLAVAAAAMGLTTLTWLAIRPNVPLLRHPLIGLGLVTVFSVLAFVLSAGFVSRAATRNSLVTKRYDQDERRLRAIVASSLTIVVPCVLAALWIFLNGHLMVGGMRLGVPAGRDLAVVAVLAATGPIGFYMRARVKRLDELEDRLPDLLSDLAESTRSGLTLSRAMVQARNNDYGVLSRDVDIMARQLSWGFSFQEAFRRFGERRKTPLVQRTVRLVIEAAHSGGNTADVLAAAGRSTYELRALEADRRSTMATQMVIIYVIFGVFLLVIAILGRQFVPQLVAATNSEETRGFFGAGPTLEELRAAYVNVILVQGVGSGIVAGVLQESRWTAGLRHVFLMTLIAYVVSRFAIL